MKKLMDLFRRDPAPAASAAPALAEVPAPVAATPAEPAAQPVADAVPRTEAQVCAAVDEKLQELRALFVEYRAVAQFRPPLFILEKPAPAIHADALASCRVFPDREALLAAVAVGKTAAEVGTQHGYWARHILQTLQPDVLHLFDYGFDWLAQDVRDHPRVSLHSGDSSTSLWKMPDGFFDWIYIDADHSYEGVCKDAVAAAFKIRADGVLIFNDYTLWSPLEAIPYGTVACVNEMLSSGDWNAIGLALTPTGYYDIALQRKPPVV